MTFFNGGPEIAGRDFDRFWFWEVEYRFSRVGRDFKRGLGQVLLLV
jgi:hypothetical protein